MQQVHGVQSVVVHQQVVQYMKTHKQLQQITQ
jgi:hypothetical protein